MSHVFPYGIALRDGGHVVLFPAVEAVFPTADGEHLTLLLLLDSGASISALPRSDAAVFGIDVERGARTSVAGIGGTLDGWQHDLTIEFAGATLRVPFVFLDVDAAPRVLGRTGIFERFTIVFEEQRRRSGCLVVGSSDATRVGGILDGCVKEI